MIRVQCRGIIGIGIYTHLYYKTRENILSFLRDYKPGTKKKNHLCRPCFKSGNALSNENNSERRP